MALFTLVNSGFGATDVTDVKNKKSLLSAYLGDRLPGAPEYKKKSLRSDFLLLSPKSKKRLKVYPTLRDRKNIGHDRG